MQGQNYPLTPLRTMSPTSGDKPNNNGVQNHENKHHDPQFLEEMAPLVSKAADSHERFLDVDIGVFDLTLKCIGGTYQGKTFNVNTSPNGEIIGGAPGYDQKRNPERLTLYIENCELQARHAQISLNHHCQYFIKDLSNHELQKNTAGIWIKVPSHGDGIDLYRNNNMLRKFTIGKHLLEFEEIPGQEFDEVSLFLTHHNATFAIFLMQQEEIYTLAQMITHMPQFLEKYKMGPEDSHLLLRITTELAINLQNKYGFQSQQELMNNLDSLNRRKSAFKLKFTHGTGNSHFNQSVVLEGDRDIVITNIQSPAASIFVNDQTIGQMSLKIYFKNGTLYMKADHSNYVDIFNAPSVLFQTYPNEKYQLQPGDIIRMGTLTFLIERFNTSVVSEIGERPAMEDTHLIIQDLGIDEVMKVSLYTVIDGHGGDQCAHFIRKNLEFELRKNLLDPHEGVFSINSANINQSIANALTKTFKNLDEQFFREQPDLAMRCGAALNAVLIFGNRIFDANIGDCRSILCRNAKALNLSHDHKTTRPDEIERVKVQGGMIQCGRVMNRLAITRALGDFEFKILHVPGGEIQRKEYITCQPEIRMMEIDPFTDDFIIMGSDGCFDKFTSQEVITFIRNKVATSDYSELPKIARELANEVIYGKSVRDNITVIIIALNRGLVVVNNIA